MDGILQGLYRVLGGFAFLVWRAFWFRSLVMYSALGHALVSTGTHGIGCCIYETQF